MKYSNSHSHGFTLVEVMISGFILALLVTVATGPFIDALRFQRGNLAVDEMTDNIQSILNSLDKEIRTGSNPRLDESGVNDALEFTNQFDETVRYVQTGESLTKTVGGASTVYGQTQSFIFEQVSFEVTEADATTPPKVTVAIRGRVTSNNSNNETITLQSTTIPRNR